MMPSRVLCPVPYRLSNMCLVSASLTEMTGNFSTPFFAMLRSRMTPVVVSSVPPTMRAVFRSLCSVDTRSHPSSMVIVGL